MFAWLRRLFTRRSDRIWPPVCPYCGGVEWYLGPEGGLSVNIMCAEQTCGHWFNFHRGIVPMDDLHMVGRHRHPG